MAEAKIDRSVTAITSVTPRSP